MQDDKRTLQSFAHGFSEALTHARRLLIVTHGNPDGDALASVSACVKVFSKHVPHCVAYAARYAHDYLRQLPHLDALLTHLSDVDPETFDTVLLVDANSFERVNLPPMFHARSFAIDHHVRDSKTTVQTSWINTDYPSATSMLFHLFQELREPIDPQLANILLCGIITDTELFQNHATNALAYRVTGSLISLGADVATMKRFGLNSVSFSTVKSMGNVLQRILVNTRYCAGAVLLDEESSLKEVLASVVKRTRLPETTFVIKSKPLGDRVEVSMRSSNRNVGLLARMLGGGGHPKAAAFRFSGKVVEQDGKMVII